MTTTDLTLGRRYLDAGGPWRERMMWEDPDATREDEPSGMVWHVDDSGIPYSSATLQPLRHDAVPDFSDPLTVMAALLALREKTRWACIFVGNDGDGWYVEGWDDFGSWQRFATEAEAIVRAWEEVARG